MIKKDLYFPMGLFIGLLLLFLSSVMEAVPGGDSSMFIGAAFSSGVAQPPGYPLITLIYKVLFFLPGDSVYLINFSSAVFTSATSVVLYFLFNNILKCKFNSLVLAALFSTLPLIFRYSLVAEVFALNNLLISITIYLAYKYSLEKEKKYAILGVFFMGLGMSHHHTFAFIALPLILWLLFNNKELRNLKFIGKLTLFGFLGLSPYLYLFISPSIAGEISWGETSSIEGFLHHFLRKDFGTFQLTATGNGGFLSNIMAFLKDLPEESFLILYILPGLWIFKDLKNFKVKSFPHLIFGMLSLYLLVFFSLANIDLSNNLFKEVFLRFWQLPLLLLTILSAYGLSFVKDNYKKKVFLLLTILVLFRAGYSFHNHNRSGMTIFKDYGSAMLDSLPKNSVLIATGDLQVNILRYLQVVKRYRTDVTVLPVPLMNLKWYKKTHKKFHSEVTLPPGEYLPQESDGRYQLLDIVNLNRSKTFYMLQDNKLVKQEPSSDLSLLKVYNWVPHGFLFKLVKKDEAVDPIKTMASHKKAKMNFNPKAYRTVEAGSWEELVTDAVFWNSERYHMIYHTRKLKENNSTSHKIAFAEYLEKLKKENSTLPPEFYKNLGLLYYQLLKVGINTRDKILSSWGEYYKTLTDTSNPEALEIKKALEHFGKKK